MIAIQNQFSKFSCDPKRGLQWKDLSFLRQMQENKNPEWISVIQPFDPNQNFFATGCFLMFPWVNRMLPNTYITDHFETDGKGYPLHGLIHQNSWELIKKEDSRFIVGNEFELTQNLAGKIINRKAKMEIAFELVNQSLKIDGTLYNLSANDWNIGIGFHPYFRLGSFVDSLSLKFPSLCRQVVLNDDLLPMSDGNKLHYHVLNERTICIENMHFDYLYEMDSGTDVSLWDETSEIGIRLKDESKDISYKNVISFNYLQVYTPGDRKSIALEPMTAPGNLENIPFITNPTLGPGNKKKFKFSISFLSS